MEDELSILKFLTKIIDVIVKYWITIPIVFYIVGYLKYCYILNALNLKTSISSIYSQFDILIAGINFLVFSLGFSIVFILVSLIGGAFASLSVNIKFSLRIIVLLLLIYTTIIIGTFLFLRFYNLPIAPIPTIIAFAILYTPTLLPNTNGKTIAFIHSIPALFIGLMIILSIHHNLKNNLSIDYINHDPIIYGDLELDFTVDGQDKIDGFLLNIKDGNYYFLYNEHLYIFSSDFVQCFTKNN